MNDNKTDLLSFLKESIGLRDSTMDSLYSNGFDSSAALMALDVSKDLPQLKTINLGQRALLRQLLREYKAFNSRPENNTEEESSCDENCCHNKKIVGKIRSVLRVNGKQSKDSLKKYKQALIRCRHEVTKLKAENLSKDIEVKKLSSELHRLRHRRNETKNNDSHNRQLESQLKEKDIYIKKLEKKILKLKNENSDLNQEFSLWHQNCLNDINKMKTYIANECMVIHKEDSSDHSIQRQSAPNDIIDDPPTLEPVLKEKIINESNSKPTNSQTEDNTPPKLFPAVITQSVDKEPLEDSVVNNKDNQNNSNSNENYISFEESVLSPSETPRNSGHLSDSSSQVVRVSKEMTFQYISPVDHNYSFTVSETTVTATKGKGRPNKMSAKRTRSNSCSEMVLRKDSKRGLNSKNTNKKLKIIEVEDIVEDNSDTHLVVVSTGQLKNSSIVAEEQRIKRDSVTLSSITGSKLISIDINGETGESDGNMTDNSSLTLKQNVVSNDNYSQIGTSNGYLSDSNEENRCSAVQTIASSLRSSTSSANRSVLQVNGKGYKCTLPDCDFMTLFEIKFNDHINNHVTYHFGQEIPDYWRPYFEEFKKNLPKFKTN